MNYQKFEELQKTSTRVQTDSEKRNETLKRFGVASGAVLPDKAALTSNAFAFDIIKAVPAAIWVLGIAVTIFAARKVIGFFSR